jgi:hypothetical protein
MNKYDFLISGIVIILVMLFFGEGKSESKIFGTVSDNQSGIVPPKTLLFSPITPEYLEHTAEEWKSTGFDGFLLSGIMRNWSDDIWKTNRNGDTPDEMNQSLLRVKKCNETCKNFGIEDNFIKIAFYDNIPFWLDDSAWHKFNQNFKAAARFAKMSRCKGIALDIEYINEQYELDWEGYTYKGYTEKDLQKAAIRRGSDLLKTILSEYPEIVFLTLPEGITFYGPLAKDFFVGMVQGMAEKNAPGGLHLLTEKSYDMTSTLGLIHYVYELETTILSVLDHSCRNYWKEKCSIALGGWPLGFYRKISNENGQFLGYSGREEIFGNKIVGSYADKSNRFSVEEFRQQYAGLLLGSKLYCWIYGHGATWWQFTENETKRFGKISNSDLPVDKNLDKFKQVVQEKWMSTKQNQKFSLLIRKNETEKLVESMGFLSSFKVNEPYGCKDCNNFETVFPPEMKIDLSHNNFEDQVEQQWKTIRCDSLTAYLDLRNYLNPSDWVCAYVFCKVISPEIQEVQIRLGTNDTATLWFNENKILSKNIERAAAPDSDILPVLLKKGENTLLVKVCNTELNWGLYIRITDINGEPVKNITAWP